MSETDFAKKKWYVLADLSTKILSSLALIALGYVGWRLQYDTQKQHDNAEIHETQARKYLPPLEALTQLQVGLTLMLEKFERPDDSPVSRVELARSGWQLRYFVDSLHIPPDVKPTIAITPLEDYKDRRKPRGRLSLDISQATAMTAEYLALQPEIKAVCGSAGKKGAAERVTISDQLPALYFAQQSGLALPGDSFIPLNPKNAEAWRKWFPEAGIGVSDLCTTPLEQLLDELAGGAGQIVAAIVDQHPDLADKAVAIRVDALRIQNALFNQPDQSK